MEPTAALTVYAVRHGETDYNRRRLMQGRRIDASLNERGELQASALADRFADVPIDAIWVSPLARARQTAEAISVRRPEIPVVVEPNLAEMSWGDLEGRSIDEVADQLRGFARSWRAGHFEERVGGGESILDVEVRARAVLDGVTAAHTTGTVVLVTHGRFLRVLLATAVDGHGLKTMDRFGHANTGVYRLLYDGSRFRTDLVNCTAHLEQLEAEA